MTITIKFYGTFKDDIGEKTILREYDGVTVRQVLADLESEFSALDGKIFDEDGDLQDSIYVLLNDSHVRHLDGSATEVTDGDKITLTPPITGG